MACSVVSTVTRGLALVAFIVLLLQVNRRILSSVCSLSSPVLCRDWTQWAGIQENLSQQWNIEL